MGEFPFVPFLLRLERSWGPDEKSLRPRSQPLRLEFRLRGGDCGRLALVAVGSETDGSIVCPSSANGLVGIKPTVGLVSRSGVIPISASQDTAARWPAPSPMRRRY